MGMRIQPRARIRQKPVEDVPVQQTEPERDVVMPASTRQNRYKKNSTFRHHRRKSPTKYKWPTGARQERLRAQVAKDRAEENKKHAANRLKAAKEREPKLMPNDIARLRKMPIRKLQHMAAVELGIKGAYRMRKDEIIERISTVSV